MAEFEPLTQGIYCIDALYVQPQVASIYLLQEQDEVAIIETGTYHSMDNVLATMAALAIDPAQVKYVIPTHVHLDHAGGAGEMMRRFSEAQLIIHPRGARHMIDPTALIAGTVKVYGEEQFDRLYGQIPPIDEQRVIVANDMERFTLTTRELLFIDTPGHARHHFCIYDEQSGGVFTGDTFGVSYAPMKKLARGLLPSTPPTQVEPEALHESVHRLIGLNPKKLFLTHYGEYLDPAAQLDSFDRWIDEYVRLCEVIDPMDEAATVTLEKALGASIHAGLTDTGQPLESILKVDIRLNAQGLAMWWQRSRRD